MEPTRIPLLRPVEAHGETLRELALREPTGKDMRLMGLPFTITAAGQVQPDGAAIHRAIVLLAGIPPSTVDRLSAPDFMAATGAVLDFFGAARTASTTPGPSST